jgi:pimeloyl-ACP methyl ester carboxylesterase
VNVDANVIHGWPPFSCGVDRLRTVDVMASRFMQERFGEVRAPTLLLHGSRDPRTEPGELEAAQRSLPAAQVAMLDAGHCPHAGQRSGGEATRLAARFLEAHAR